jgi:hypothetical protein
VDVMQAESNQVVISFQNDYLKNFKIESIFPEPKRNNVSQQQTHYHIDAKDQLSVVFQLVPQEIGNIE